MGEGYQRGAGAETLVVIPIYNEARTVVEVIAGPRPHPVDVLVVDDGSADDGGARAAAAGAEVLRLDPNRGKGIALQEGFRVARERGYRSVVTIDGDMEHDPAELPAILDALDAGYDMVVGQRDVFRSGVRRAINRFANFWYRQIDPRITDTICGYRGFRAEVFDDLFVPERGFEFEQIVLLEGYRRGLTVTFVPVQVRSADKTGVAFADLVRANNAFDRWVLDNAAELPLSRSRKVFIRAAALAGLALGWPLERMTR